MSHDDAELIEQLAAAREDNVKLTEERDLWKLAAQARLGCSCPPRICVTMHATPGCRYCTGTGHGSRCPAPGATCRVCNRGSIWEAWARMLRWQAATSATPEGYAAWLSGRADRRARGPTSPRPSAKDVGVPGGSGCRIEWENGWDEEDRRLGGRTPEPLSEFLSREFFQLETDCLVLDYAAIADDPDMPPEVRGAAAEAARLLATVSVIGSAPRPKDP